MSDRELKAGTNLYFGAPAKPLPDVTIKAITQVVKRVPDILEAHLPQCFIEGEKEARQVLVVGVKSSDDIPRVGETLMHKLASTLSQGELEFIDVMPFESGLIPAGVRKAGCQIFSSETKPWWKIW
ncbi:MAG: hypothetical protein AAB370_11480 [Verrucomicrobiota bacterium]